MINSRIGVKVGRLTNFYDRIEKFPIRTWKKELFSLSQLGISLIEWSISNQSFYYNPILNEKLNSELNFLKRKYNISINSIVLDFIIQKPFWRFKGDIRKNLEKRFFDCLDSCVNNKINKIIFPIIDNSSFLNSEEQNEVKSFLVSLENYLKSSNLQIYIETDLKPKLLQNFICDLNIKYFKICYDTGNSAGNQYDIDQEFKLYGNYINLIHIKDKNKNNKSVLLGTGSCNFEKLFNSIKAINYQGSFIFETYKKPPLLKNLEYQIKFFKDEYNRFS